MSSIDRDMQFVLMYVNRMIQMYQKLLQKANSTINTLNVEGDENNGKIRSIVSDYRKDEDKIFRNNTIDKDSFVASITVLSEVGSSKLAHYHNILNGNYRKFKWYGEQYQRLIDTVKIKKEIYERKGHQVKSFAYQKILIALLREKNAVDGIYARIGRLLPDSYR